MLGIDTGGTFTDAVLMDETGSDIVASAKSPTTHQDLAVGVGGAVRAVLDAAGADSAAQIRLVSLSTTLATNALVEGHGELAGLITLGFSPRELERTGIGAALGDSALMANMEGGHDAHGNEAAPVDQAVLSAAIQSIAPRVSAFAVAAQFSVRNPAHERTAAELIRSVTGLPVTSSHVLSAKLHGPRRALTAVLNAKLLGTIDRLNRAVASVLAAESISAPLMVVRGDGSLVTAEFARNRPIETILSGPAASVVGALHLANLDSGLVVDIGGTTTDIAVIEQGRPSLAAGGAAVGNHRTMVEAVDMATIGLGGDSEVCIDTRAVNGPILLGPERAIPVCRLAVEHPNVHLFLDRQLAAPLGLTTHGRFLVSTAPTAVAVIDTREAEVLDRLGAGPLPLLEVAESGLQLRAVTRLQARGLVRIATMTPTDACAVLGTLDGVDVEAAAKVASILARQTNATGGVVAEDAIALSEQVVERLISESARFALRVAFAFDGIEADEAADIVGASLRSHQGATSIAIGLSSPVTAIGAPAAAYYERVGAALNTEAVVPPYAEVANAVGAVVGQVRVRRSATITQPTRGQYRVHLEDQPTFGSVESARQAATEMLTDAALVEADTAGAVTPETVESWDARWATVNDKEVFVEGVLTVEASGRPRFSQHSP